MTDDECNRLIFDPRLIAAFYKHPELFRDLRNRNYEFFKENETFASREASLTAWNTLDNLLPESILPNLQALERVWDRIDQEEFDK